MTQSTASLALYRRAELTGERFELLRDRNVCPDESIRGAEPYVWRGLTADGSWLGSLRAEDAEPSAVPEDQEDFDRSEV